MPPFYTEIEIDEVADRVKLTVNFGDGGSSKAKGEKQGVVPTTVFTWSPELDRKKLLVDVEVIESTFWVPTSLRATNRMTKMERVRDLKKKEERAERKFSGSVEFDASESLFWVGLLEFRVDPFPDVVARLAVNLQGATANFVLAEGDSREIVVPFWWESTGSASKYPMLFVEIPRFDSDDVLGFEFVKKWLASDGTDDPVQSPNERYVDAYRVNSGEKIAIRVANAHNDSRRCVLLSRDAENFVIASVRVVGVASSRRDPSDVEHATPTIEVPYVSNDDLVKFVGDAIASFPECAVLEEQESTETRPSQPSGDILPPSSPTPKLKIERSDEPGSTTDVDETPPSSPSMLTRPSTLEKRKSSLLLFDQPPRRLRVAKMRIYVSDRIGDVGDVVQFDLDPTRFSLTCRYDGTKMTRDEGLRELHSRLTSTSTAVGSEARGFRRIVKVCLDKLDDEERRRGRMRRWSRELRHELEKFVTTGNLETKMLFGVATWDPKSTPSVVRMDENAEIVEIKGDERVATARGMMYGLYRFSSMATLESDAPRSRRAYSIVWTGIAEPRPLAVSLETDKIEEVDDEFVSDDKWTLCDGYGSAIGAVETGKFSLYPLTRWRAKIDDAEFANECDPKYRRDAIVSFVGGKKKTCVRCGKNFVDDPISNAHGKCRWHTTPACGAEARRLLGTDPEFEKKVLESRGSTTKFPLFAFGKSGSVGAVEWACCGRSASASSSDEVGFCWIGRHSATDPMPDLYSTMSHPPSPGTEWSPSPLTNGGRRRAWQDAVAKRDWDEALLHEQVANRALGACSIDVRSAASKVAWVTFEDVDASAAKKTSESESDVDAMSMRGLEFSAWRFARKFRDEGISTDIDAARYASTMREGPEAKSSRAEYAPAKSASGRLEVAIDAPPTATPDSRVVSAIASRISRLKKQIDARILPKEDALAKSATAAIAATKASLGKPPVDVAKIRRTMDGLDAIENVLVGRDKGRVDLIRKMDAKRAQVLRDVPSKNVDETNVVIEDAKRTGLGKYAELSARTGSDEIVAAEKKTPKLVAENSKIAFSKDVSVAFDAFLLALVDVESKAEMRSLANLVSRWKSALADLFGVGKAPVKILDPIDDQKLLMSYKTNFRKATNSEVGAALKNAVDRIDAIENRISEKKMATAESPRADRRVDPHKYEETLERLDRLSRDLDAARRAIVELRNSGLELKSRVAKTNEEFGASGIEDGLEKLGKMNDEIVEFGARATAALDKSNRVVKDITKMRRYVESPSFLDRDWDDKNARFKVYAQ